MVIRTTEYRGLIIKGSSTLPGSLSFSAPLPWQPRALQVFNVASASHRSMCRRTGIRCSPRGLVVKLFREPPSCNGRYQGGAQECRLPAASWDLSLPYSPLLSSLRNHIQQGYRIPRAWNHSRILPPYGAESIVEKTTYTKGIASTTIRNNNGELINFYGTFFTIQNNKCINGQYAATKLNPDSTHIYHFLPDSEEI